MPRRRSRPRRCGLPPVLRWSRRPVLGGRRASPRYWPSWWRCAPLSSPRRAQGELLAKRPERLLEARVSAPDADRYRPAGRGDDGGDGAAEELSLEDLAVLQKSDRTALVAAYLVRDERGLAEQALRETGGAGTSRRTWTVIGRWRCCVKGEPEEALRLLDAALARDPRHPQALWNRALVLRELGLPLAGRPGLLRGGRPARSPAGPRRRRKAEALAARHVARRSGGRRSAKAGEALLDGGPRHAPRGLPRLPGSPASLLRRRPCGAHPRAQCWRCSRWPRRSMPRGRRATSSRSYVRRVAEADFSAARPLARELRGPGQRGPSSSRGAAASSARLARVEGGRHPPGRARHGGGHRTPHRGVSRPRPPPAATPGSSCSPRRSARRSTSPPGGGHALPRRCSTHGGAARDAGSSTAASSDRSRSVQPLHPAPRAPTTARRHAERGWKEARASNEWGLESATLWSLVQIARLGSDAPWLAPTWESSRASRDNPDTPRRAHQELAVMAMQELRVDEARREIDAALATGVPLAVSGAFALADIARLKGGAGDEAHLTRSLEKIQPGLSPGERAIATHALGRFFIERDVERGRGLLWRCHRGGGGSGARGGQGGSAGAGLQLHLPPPRGGPAPVPSGGARAVRARARSGAAAPVPAGGHRGLRADPAHRAWEPPGSCSATYDQARRQPLSPRLDGLVPEPLLAALRGCEQVEVLARPPLHGRAGLLPPELAWSYLTRLGAPRTPPQVGPAVHLVVSDVELPPKLSLKRLNTWTPSFGPRRAARHALGSQRDAFPGPRRHEDGHGD